MDLMHLTIVQKYMSHDLHVSTWASNSMLPSIVNVSLAWAILSGCRTSEYPTVSAPSSCHRYISLSRFDHVTTDQRGFLFHRLHVTRPAGKLWLITTVLWCTHVTARTWPDARDQIHVTKWTGSNAPDWKSRRECYYVRKVWNGCYEMVLVDLDE